MRTYDEITADAEKRSAFSNGTEYEMWAGRGRGCYDCANDDLAIGGDEKNCPILSASLLGMWPKEWTREQHEWTIGDKSGSYERVGECTEFDRRPDDDGPDDDDGPPPAPGRRRSSTGKSTCSKSSPTSSSPRCPSPRGRCDEPPVTWAAQPEPGRPGRAAQGGMGSAATAGAADRNAHPRRHPRPE